MTSGALRNMVVGVVVELVKKGVDKGTIIWGRETPIVTFVGNGAMVIVIVVVIYEEVVVGDSGGECI